MPTSVSPTIPPPRKPPDLSFDEVYDRFEQRRLDLEAQNRQRAADRAAGIFPREDRGFRGEIEDAYRRQRERRIAKRLRAM